MSFFRNAHRDERGQTALETAIILIAFIVVASVFAFTILSAGTASTEQGEDAIYAGLQGVQSTMATTGTTLAQDTDADGNVDSIVFNVKLAGGGDPVDLEDTAGSNVVVLSYRDATQVVNDLPFTVAFVGANNSNKLLEANELAEITVDVTTATGGLTNALAKNTEFTIEVKPPTGGVLPLNNTTPAAIDAVTELR